jgi:hypothetical protein
MIGNWNCDKHIGIEEYFYKDKFSLKKMPWHYKVFPSYGGHNVCKNWKYILLQK